MIDLWNKTLEDCQREIENGNLAKALGIAKQHQSRIYHADRDVRILEARIYEYKNSINSLVENLNKRDATNQELIQSAAGAKHALQIVKDAIADIFKEVKNE